MFYNSARFFIGCLLLVLVSACGSSDKLGSQSSSQKAANRSVLHLEIKDPNSADGATLATIDQTEEFSGEYNDNKHVGYEVLLHRSIELQKVESRIAIKKDTVKGVTTNIQVPENRKLRIGFTTTLPLNENHVQTDADYFGGQVYVDVVNKQGESSFDFEADVTCKVKMEKNSFGNTSLFVFESANRYSEPRFSVSFECVDFQDNPTVSGYFLLNTNAIPAIN